MAKPPDCGNCQKPATIHLTQIINNQIKKLDFCEDCPYQKGVTDPEGFSLAELLAHGGPAVPLDSKLACPACGLTSQEFKKTGRLGCAECYDTFRDIIEPMLEGMHKGDTHLGKAPRGMLERVSYRREVERIRRDLAEAVSDERFEDAARFRDALKQLETGPVSKDLPDSSD